MPREIIYVPPADTQTPEITPRSETADAAALLRSGSHAAGNSLAALEAPIADEHPFGGDGRFELANSESASNAFDTSPAASLTAPTPADLGLFAANTAVANEAAFSGVVAPVPEPSAWAMTLSGAGALVAALRRRKRK